MATRTSAKRQDKATRAIFAALKAAFPGLPDDINRVVYRYNSVSIRVLIVDDRFAGLSSAARHRLVEKALERLPREIVDDISMLVMRTPQEMDGAAERGDLIYLEFNDPSRSDLL